MGHEVAKSEEHEGSNETPPKSYVSTVASRLAGLILEHNLRKGRTVEIPSLGIILNAQDLKEQPYEDEQEETRPSVTDEAESPDLNAMPESSVPAVSSGLAGLILKHHLEKGGSFEIPSLGIRLTREDLRDPGKPDDTQNEE